MGGKERRREGRGLGLIMNDYCILFFLCYQDEGGSPLHVFPKVPSASSVLKYDGSVAIKMPEHEDST